MIATTMVVLLLVCHTMSVFGLSASDHVTFSSLRQTDSSLVSPCEGLSEPPRLWQ